MADLKSAQATFEAFRKAYDAGDTAKTASLMGTLKVAITTFTALPPTFADVPSAAEELKLARDLLEHAVLFAVAQKVRP